MVMPHWQHETRNLAITKAVPVTDIDFNQILRESIPQWNQARFLFLEPERWWAPSVQAELARPGTLPIQARFGSTPSKTSNVTDYRCHSLATTRAIHDQVQAGQVAGIVLITGKQMRDCLLFLGRLSRLGRPHPPVLLVIPRNAVSLMPTLMESGAASVMIQTVTDIQIADWCRRAADTNHRGVLRSFYSYSGSSR